VISVVKIVVPVVFPSISTKILITMRFGICSTVQRAGEVRWTGADFLEESIQGFLQGLVPDAEWHGAEAARACPLPILAANMLVPADLKVVGPNVDFEKLQKYIAAVATRARQTGMKILVFGSGGARNVPDGFDRARAEQQIIEFCKMAADACQRNNITLAIEPLNRKECNIVNTITEAAKYVKAVNHRAFRCLLDTYHFWLENEPLEAIEPVLPSIAHVHVADKDGRVAPGESGKSDYRPIFHLLKRANYAGAVSVEAVGFTDFESMGRRVIAFLHRQWDEA
jgi:sugar phosphate isomerase/epimerase